MTQIFVKGSRDLFMKSDIFFILSVKVFSVNVICVRRFLHIHYGFLFIVKPQRNTTQLTATLKQLALELDIVAK